MNFSDKIFSLHDETHHKLLRVLALQKDQEVYNNIRDIKIKSSSNDIQSLNTTSSCEQDLSKVYITFTCPNELSKLQKSVNMISDAKDILARMDIDINSIGIMPIRSAHFQHIKIGKAYEPALCIYFTSSNIASYVRKKITCFNSNLFDQGKVDEMRYCDKIYWSKNVWRILKIAYEMKRSKLISRVKVCPDGILIHYNDISKLHTSNSLKYVKIKCFDDLNNLRKLVQDIYSEISCEILYDDNYFMLCNDDRDKRRLKATQMHQMDLDSDDDLS